MVITFEINRVLEFYNIDLQYAIILVGPPVPKDLMGRMITLRSHFDLEGLWLPIIELYCGGLIFSRR